MNDSQLVIQSIEFSISIIKYYKWLRTEKHEYVLSKQLLKSATSIGANIHEAKYAISKPDFISKLQIALKEASETEYWTLLLEKTELLPKAYCNLPEKCGSLKKMLITSLKTLKDT